MLEINTPNATAKDETKPMAASPCNPAFSLSFSIKNEDNIVSGIDTTKGDLFKNSAMAIVAKLT